jgi:leucyl-tRNA synthetase
MMIFVNEATKSDLRPRQILEPFVLLLAPFAPHLAEELWEKLGHRKSLVCEPWPVHDEVKLQRKTVEVVLQVNGKLRSRVAVPVDTPAKELEIRALSDPGLQKYIEGKTVVKAIVVANKLVNIVVQ